MSETPYHPIDCGLHSRYELAIMQKRQFKLCWRDRRGGLHLEVVRPLDLRTRAHAEFMIARNAEGQKRIIRLDRIIKAEPNP